jgi:hypothetical protein
MKVLLLEVERKDIKNMKLLNSDIMDAVAGHNMPFIFIDCLKINVIDNEYWNESDVMSLFKGIFETTFKMKKCVSNVICNAPCNMRLGVENLFFIGCNELCTKHMKIDYKNISFVTETYIPETYTVIDDLFKDENKHKKVGTKHRKCPMANKNKRVKVDEHGECLMDDGVIQILHDMHFDGEYFGFDEL